jgi:molybdopterin biosynthesis enzyme
MTERTRQRFQDSVRKKVDWYGGELLGFADLDKDPDAVAETIDGYVNQGADLVLAGGGNTIDPLDATIQALPKVGAEIVMFGAPVHPGSMLWLAYREDMPVFNLASCSMYSRSTSADLILPWIMAGERIGARDIAALGYGGSLDRDMQYRFPPYDSESVSEPSEE